MEHDIEVEAPLARGVVLDPSLRAPHPGPRRHRAGLFLGSHVCSQYTFGTVFLCHSRSERRGVGRVRGDSGVENDGCVDVLLNFLQTSKIIFACNY